MLYFGGPERARRSVEEHRRIIAVALADIAHRTASVTEAAPTARNTSPETRRSASPGIATLRNCAERVPGPPHSRTPYPPSTLTNRSSLTTGAHLR